MAGREFIVSILNTYAGTIRTVLVLASDASDAFVQARKQYSITKGDRIQHAKTWAEIEAVTAAVH